MTTHILSIEAPLYEDLLFQRLARAGGNIRETVNNAIGRIVVVVDDDDRRLVWPLDADTKALVPFRHSLLGDRMHADVPLWELASLALRFIREGGDRDETVRRMAQHFELGRFRSVTQERFERAYSPYGPCNVADLHTAGFDYWAPGHIHQGSQHAGERAVIMPGMPQGRDINESGEKTVSLVTIGDDHSIFIEERLTSIAQFERLTIDVSNATDWRDFVGAIETALVDKRHGTRPEHLVGRLKLVGNTSLA